MIQRGKNTGMGESEILAWSPASCSFISCGFGQIMTFFFFSLLPDLTFSNAMTKQCGFKDCTQFCVIKI